MQWRLSSALATTAKRWWVAQRVPVVWPSAMDEQRRGREREVAAVATGSPGEAPAAVAFIARGLGLQGVPMILGVHAQAGTRGAHQAAWKPGRCRDTHAEAGVASGGGGVWELGAALGFRRLGRRSWAKPGRGGRERASALLGRAAGPSTRASQAARERKGVWASGAG